MIAGTVLVDFLYVYAIRHWTASAAAYALIVIPPLTVIYGAVLLDETVSPVFLVGGTITLIGVWVGAFWLKTRPREA